jgi:hypothetical protein
MMKAAATTNTVTINSGIEYSTVDGITIVKENVISTSTE